MADVGEEKRQADDDVNLEDAIRRRILARDKRYHIYAYEFIFDALAFTQQQSNAEKVKGASPRHVRGQELLEGIRELARHRFGALAPTVFRSWGVERTEDFGEVVFNLVDNRLLRKTEEDRREDFAGGFSFDEAFGGPISLQ